MLRQGSGGVSAGARSAGPPLLRKPQTSIAKKGETPARALKMGYIYGVAPDNIQPTSCSVVIDNQPPLNGFGLPAGTGLILPFGTNEYQGMPFYGPWTMDPTTLQGGTQVLVDLDSMSVIQIMHTPSGTDYNSGFGSIGYVPSTGETLVGTHVHTGGYDSDGHLLPSPIGTSQLNFNPFPTVPPVINNLQPFTYSVNGKTTFDVTIGFQTDQQNPDWLRYVAIYAVRHDDPEPVPGATSAWTVLAPNSEGVYSSVKILNLGADDAWDLYATYRDHTGNETPPAFIATTNNYPSPVSVYLPTLAMLADVIDPGGSLLNVEFPGTAISPTGGLIYVNGVTSSMAYPLVAGQLVELSVELARVP